MKINDIDFYGFTREELDAFRIKTGNDGEKEFSLGFIQELSDVVGDVMTIIQPGGQVSLIKAGEQYVK